MKSILVLQTQRLGDLILTFPLILWLSRLYPGCRIMVVAEEAFYTQLLPVSPPAVYVPLSRPDVVLKETFDLVVNLSIRPEAADLAGRVRAGEKLGPVAEPGGGAYVRGSWQLYRASLVNNNRYNRFHWAELNALDVVPLSKMASTRWPDPDGGRAEPRKVGVFLGASEAAKTPPWGWLKAFMGEMLKRGLEPVLFGGPGEREVARQVVRGVGGPVTNFCGKLSIAELAGLLPTCGLFATPDTGPMHLAAFVSAPVLNLSMGNVNPWETGPYQPGHAVLSAGASCAGCWGECSRSPRPCQRAVPPARAASLAKSLMGGGVERAARMRLPKADLWATARSGQGLYHLDRLWPGPDRARDRLSTFWSAFWGHRFGLWGSEPVQGAWAELSRSRPEAAQSLSTALGRVGSELLKARKSGLPDDFWQRFPPLVRPLTGFMHMDIQNRDYAPKAWADCLLMVESLTALDPVV